MLLPLGDVTEDHGEEPAARQVESRDRRFGGKLRAVPAEAHDRLPLAHAARDLGTGPEVLDVPGVDRMQPRGQELRERLADHVRRAPPERAFGALIEDDDPLLFIDRDDRVDGKGCDAGGLLLRRAQLIEQNSGLRLVARDGAHGDEERYQTREPEPEDEGGWRPRSVPNRGEQRGGSNGHDGRPRDQQRVP